MKTRVLLMTGSMLVLSMSLFASQAPAQSNPLYFQLGSAKAALYMPDNNPNPRIAVVSAHEDGNHLANPRVIEMARRGFIALGLNTRAENNEALDFWDDLALDVGAGVKFLKDRFKNVPNFRVVLLGHSGGGALFSYYQNVAENGPSVCQGPNKLTQCGKGLAGLPPADGLIVSDAHLGTGVSELRSLDPSMSDEKRPDQVIPGLDPFSPRNGYNPKGPSSYSEEFKRRYFKAQADRMNRLIDEAIDIRTRMEEGKYHYTGDDDVFVIPRGDCARLFEFDMTILHSTLNPQKLLKNDYTIAKQIIESVRVPNLRMVNRIKTFECTRPLTVKSFLGSRAVRAKDSISDIDFCSSNNSTNCNLQNIRRAPVLIIAGQAHYFVSDSELMYETAASPDKDFVVIEGQLHDTTPCVACEKTKGQYSNAQSNYYRYIVEWINARF